MSLLVNAICQRITTHPTINPNSYLLWFLTHRISFCLEDLLSETAATHKSSVRRSPAFLLYLSVKKNCYALMCNVMHLCVVALLCDLLRLGLYFICTCEPTKLIAIVVNAQEQHVSSLAWWEMQDNESTHAVYGVCNHLQIWIDGTRLPRCTAAVSF